MFKKFVFVLGLYAQIIACSGSPTVTPKQQSSPATGNVTVAAPDGLEIAATVHSVGDPTIIFIHGWMCDQSYWSEQIEPLTARFGVVAVDLAGHGRSGTVRNAWTIASLGADVAALINHLDLDRTIVVGHSMGGRVGLEVARLSPSSVIAVVGVDTLQNADETWDPKEAGQFLEAMEQDFRSTCTPFVGSMFGENAESGLVDRISDDMCGGPGDIGLALLRDYVDFDLKQAFLDVDVPIRCINADKWPTAVEANQKYCDFEASILEGYGHFLMQEAPQALNNALIETLTALSDLDPPTGTR